MMLPVTTIRAAEDGFEVRLARTADEVEAAQRLRHGVFRDGDADALSASGADRDRFDDHCLHLVVLDHRRASGFLGRIVGTCRLLTEAAALRSGGHYSADEFRLDDLVRRDSARRFLELGRSCVLPDYRSRRVIDLLWQGIWAICLRERIDVLVGCASFPGTVPAMHAEALAYLHHFAKAEGDYACSALPGRGICTDLMPREAIDPQRAIAALPPLVKGYLRLGALYGGEAVIDHDFGTTDVLTILPVERIAARYRARFTPRATAMFGAIAA